jgi:RNA polymerase sigma-70 factor, ECF subfamily
MDEGGAMDSRTGSARWARLTGLLQPIHQHAVAVARRLCRSVDEGDDLYQEAVLRAFDKLDGLRDESRFRSWFFATLLSRHRSRLRRATRQPVPLEAAFEPGQEPMGHDGSVWEEEHRGARRVARALSALGPDQREAVVLFEIEGFSVEEIAELQGVTVSAVKSRLARGRERLRRFYERERAKSTRVTAEGATAAVVAWPGKGEVP